MSPLSKLVDRDLAVHERLEERETRPLWLRVRDAELPVEGELGDVLVPPRNRFPDPVVAGLLVGLGAVHQGVRRDLVGGHVGDRFRVRAVPRIAVRADLCGHLVERLHDREGEQAELDRPGNGRRSLGGRGHPGRWVRILVRLRSDEPTRELERRAVPLEVLLAPHRADDLDGLRPLGAAGLAVDVERGLLHWRGAAGAPLDTTLREDVGRRHLLGDSRAGG